MKYTIELKEFCNKNEIISILNEEVIFDINMLSEGIVWTCKTKDGKDGQLMFKTKGDKHKSSNFRTIAPVDTEKLESIQSFVEYAVTESRFEQALKTIFPNGELIDIKKLGDVILWIIRDIIKEESDTLSENNLTIKDANKYISTKVRKMFLDIYKV